MARRVSAAIAAMADDEDAYVDSFEQGDDSALMAAIQQRDAAVMQLLKCARRGRAVNIIK